MMQVTVTVTVTVNRGRRGCAGAGVTEARAPTNNTPIWYLVPIWLVCPHLDIRYRESFALHSSRVNIMFKGIIHILYATQQAIPNT